MLIRRLSTLLPTRSVVCRYVSGSRHVGQPIHQTHPHLIDGDDLTPGFSLNEYEDRQLFLLSRLPVGSVALISSSSVKYQSWSIPYEYKQNSSFHYLCGIDQPDLLLVLQKLQRNQVRRCLFMKDKPDGRVGCVTPHLYPEDAKLYFGITETYDISTIASVLPSVIGEAKSIYTYTTADSSINKEVTSVLKGLEGLTVSPLIPELDRIRWIKSLNEQKQLRYSASICTSAFNELSSIPLIGIENRLSTAFEYNVKLRGAQSVAFPTQIAGGSNSQYVQYSCNDCIINPGDNILIDCGVLMNGYNSDMARVVFAGEMKSGIKARADVYLGVNEVYESCLQMIRSEETCSLQDVHLTIVRELTKLLKEIGVMKSSSVETIVEQKLYFKYFPHYSCHYIGLDNNDTPTVGYSTPLTPGVAFCIEPGLYFDGDDEIPEELRHFGVRMEDTFLYVDSKTVDVLTKDSPRIPSNLL